MSSLHYLLMKSQALCQKEILSQAGAIHLTPGQPKILECLLILHEADQKSIAAYCEIEPATVGSILFRMEESGLVTRRQKQGNRRSLFVSLTEKGTEAAEEVGRIFAGVEQQATRNFTGEEIAQLKRLLEKLCAGMSAQEKGGRG